MYYKEQEIRKKFAEYLPNCIGQRLGDIYDSLGDENERYEGYKPFVKNYFGIGEQPDIKINYAEFKDWVSLWHDKSYAWFTKDSIFYVNYILIVDEIDKKWNNKRSTGAIFDSPVSLACVYIERVVSFIVDDACLLDYETGEYKNFYNPDSIVTQEIINDLIEKIKTQTLAWDWEKDE